MTDLEKYLLGRLGYIADFTMPDDMRETSEEEWGIGADEAIEMAYENVILEAQAAIKRADAMLKARGGEDG